MADRQTHVADIARAALARDAAMREVFLREACHGDPTLRLEVDAAIGASGAVSETEPVTVSTPSPGGAAPPRASDIAHVESLLAAAGKSDHYRVQSRLGMGGMGAVYKAFDTTLKRAVAIKAVLGVPSALAPSLGRLRKEALAAALLDHPYICKVYELIDTAQGQLIVMEFVEGETLSRRLRRGRPSLEAALQWGIEIAEGLADAHDRGLVHRDLTPGNVMVTTHGHVKLLDFGLAHPDASTAPTADTDGAPRSIDRPAGTPAYMAPEQAEGRPVTARADVFALGVVLCECLTGTLPFGKGPWDEYVTRMRSAAATPIRELAPTVPPDLAHLIDRCLDRVPANRPQSAREVVLALRQVAAALTPPDARRRWVGRAAWAVAAVAALVAATMAWQSFSGEANPPAWRSRPLVTSSAQESRGRISPDKQWISYLSTAGGVTQLLVRRVEGGDATRVSVPDGTILDQLWSPDGTQVAYVLRQGRTVSLQVVRAFFGGVPSQTIPIERAGVEVRLIRWIGRAVYVEMERATPLLLRFDLDTSKVANLTELWKVSGTPRGFDVTPDGNRVVFTTSSGNQEDLWVSGLDGASARRLTNDEPFERYARWVDGNTTLIYQSNRGGQVDLWGMSVNGGQPWPITSSQGIEKAESVSSDGTLLTFVQEEDDSHLWMWNPPGNGAIQLTDDALSDFAPAATATASTVVFQRKRPTPLLPSLTDSTLLLGSLNPQSKSLANPRVVADGFAARVSPDGSWVAYLQRGSTSGTTLSVKHLPTDRTATVSSLAKRPVSSLQPIDWAEQNVAWSRTSTDLYFIEQGPPPGLKRYRVGSTEPSAPLQVGEQGQVFRDLRPSPDDRFLAYLIASPAGSNTGSPAGSKLCVLDLSTGITRVVGQFQAAAYLRGWTAGGTALVVVQATNNHEDFTADIDVLVVPVGKAGVRKAGIERALIATTRLDPVRGILYLARAEAGIQNMYSFSLADGSLRKVTDNVRPGVAFSGFELLDDGRILGVRAEHKSDVWIAERQR